MSKQQQTRRAQLEQAIQQMTDTAPNPRDYASLDRYYEDWSAFILARGRLLNELDNEAADERA